MIREIPLEHVAPGWPLVSTRRKMFDEFTPLRGTCVEIAPGWTDLDSGELVPARYRILMSFRVEHPWDWLDADEIDTGQLYGVDRGAAEVGALWCMRAAVHRPRGSKSDRLYEVERVHDAWRLAAAWAGIR